ncbi:MAG: copper resistance CopC family protein [bacterium]
MSYMRVFGRSLLLVAGLGSAVAATPRAHMADEYFHTRLLKSEPLANDTVKAAPRALKLWFSEKVELPVTSVKLTDATGAAIRLSLAARPDSAESAPVIVGVVGPLVAGSYRVSWSTAAKDGHPAKGTFSFVVAPSR